jgi:hypothetical protein
MGLQSQIIPLALSILIWNWYKNGVPHYSLAGLVEQGYPFGEDWNTEDVTARVLNTLRYHLMGNRKLSC